MSELIDNRTQKRNALKDIIRHLHAGLAPDEVRGQLRQMVRETDPSEIVAMEQELISEGMPVTEIQSMCDLHSQVTREVLVPFPAQPIPPGHPADTFRRENEALRGAIRSMREIMGELAQWPDEDQPGDLPLRWRQALNDLMDIDKHYQRKEHVFFSYLEKHGITGPSSVMWAKDDQVRAMLKALGAALGRPRIIASYARQVAAEVAEPALRAVEEMFYKEENILLPMCLRTFTPEQWGEIWSASPRYGWCLVEPRTGYRPVAAKSEDALTGDIVLPTGCLSVDQLLGIFSILPVDLTFVDADDRVAFFSEGPDRIFSRSRAIIGRKVQNCHPPRSVETVERILSDFREGRQNVAEFWIRMEGRFIHIRYFAVRDPEGRYAGTLEVTQDLTRLRGLEGERRLLEYDTAAPVAS